MSILPLIIVLACLTGCVAPQRVVTLSELTTAPEQYLDGTVKFSGIVEETDYSEGRYNGGIKRRLYLTITDGAESVYGYMEGYNKGRILRAMRLAERARIEGGEVTVTGKVTSLAPGTELKLNRLQYGGESVYMGERHFYTSPGYPHYGHHWHYPYGLFGRHYYGHRYGPYYGHHYGHHYYGHH